MALSPEKKKHAAWLATPRPHRVPKTKREWAEFLGVTDRTLRRWEQDEELWDEVWRLVGMEVDDRLPEVLGHLVDVALSDKDAAAVGAAKLLLQVRGRLVERQAVEVKGDVQFTADDYAGAVEDLERWERERLGVEWEAGNGESEV